MRALLRRLPAPLLPCAALLAASSVAPSRADACAVAPPMDRSVTVSHEDALIAWDDTTHTEHFIRKAVFESNASDFGFLVPTPTQPALAEADETLFSRLETLTRPEVHEEWRWIPVLLCFAPFMVMGSKAAPPTAATEAVRVLDVQQVAGLDAAVLEADSAGALGDWLKAHGYPFRPALLDWVTPYVAKKWKLTAFKLADTRIAANDPVEGGAPMALPAASTPGRAHTVRMSFAADRPFYPYREPTDSRSGDERELRLYVLSSARMDGTLENGPTEWGGRVEYAQPAAQAGDLKTLVQGISGSFSPGWLMSFRDAVQRRPQADLFFVRGADAAVKPPPDVKTSELPIPVDLLFFAGIGVALWVRRARRKRAAPTEAP